ncbi:MAG TPA: DUF1292 domain-containing protein [Lachnospiraceae bacterium]|nr:DUF1292 domain-containing protein [Lachnospiraceae bacterium]
MEKIQFAVDDGKETAEFYVLDQTRINGRDYLLVAESTEDEAEALILRDTAPEDAQESVYEIVSDDTELSAVAKVFEEMIGDIEFKQED